MSINNSKSFKYKSALLEETEGADKNTNSSVKAKILVPLKYLSNFWRSSDMAWINCKVHLGLKAVSCLVMETLQNSE